MDHPTSLDLLFLPSSVEREPCSSVCFCQKEDPPLLLQLSPLLSSGASFHGNEIMVSEAGLAMQFLAGTCTRHLDLKGGVTCSDSFSWADWAPQEGKLTQDMLSS